MASTRIRIVVAACAVAAMVGASYFYARGLVSDDPNDVSDPELMVQATRAANPGLAIEEEPGRGRPYVWVKDIATGRQVQFPWSELPHATIRFVDCDLGRIPTGVLYPNRTAMACVEMRNDKHAMSSYYFRSNDDLAHVLDFFELNMPSEQRRSLGSGRAPPSIESVRRQPSTGAFVVSYLLMQGAGFVGYAEERR